MKTTRIALVLLLLLFTPLLVTGVSFDLGRVNYPDPIIGVIYDRPVEIVRTSGANTITRLDQLEPTYTPNIGLETKSVSGTLPDEDHELWPSSGNLGQGFYSLSVTAKTPNGLTTTDSATFDVTGLQIRIGAPASGYATSTPYGIRVDTGVDDGEGGFVLLNAECKYLLSGIPGDTLWTNPAWRTDITTTNKQTDPNQYQTGGVGAYHTITGLSTESSELTLICRAYKLNGNALVPVLQTFNIGTYTTPPTLDITVTPTRVTDTTRPYAGVYVVTNQPSWCEISKDGASFIPFTTDPEETAYADYTTEHSHQVRFDNNDAVNIDLTGDLSHHDFTYAIRCKNLAGLIKNEQTQIAVDFDTPLSITVLSPSTLTNQDPVPVNITTNIPAACTLSGTAMTKTTSQYTAQVTTETYKNYSLVTECIGGGKKTNTTINFTTDRVPPANVKIITSNTLCNGNATAELTANENHQIRQYVWKISDSGGEVLASGTSLSGIIEATLPTTTTQQLKWEAYAEDIAGNKGTASPVTVVAAPGTSDECDPSPFIQYYTPQMGWGTIPFTIVVKSKRPAICGWLYNLPGVDGTWNHNPAITTDYFLHTIDATRPSTTHPQQAFHITCTEQDNTNHSTVLEFGILNETPKILVAQANPNPVIDYQHKYTDVTVQTNHETVCMLTLSATSAVNEFFTGEDPAVYSTYKKDHAHTLLFEDITTYDLLHYEYLVTCTDRAQQTVSQALPIDVDFLQTFSIAVIEPKKYINTPNTNLVIKPQLQDVFCEYRTPDSGINGQYFSMTPDGTTQKATLSTTFAEGAHSIAIRCISPSAGEASAIAQFTVDTKKPTLSFTGADRVCQDKTSAIIINATDETSINYTQLTIVGNTTTRINTTSDRYVIDGALQQTGTITITGTTYDQAGNPSTSATHTLEVYKAGNPLCLAVCGNGEIEAPEECDDGNTQAGDGCNACKKEPTRCGDGLVDFINGEQCEDVVPSGATCTDFDTFSGGQLSCDTSCLINTSRCVAPSPSCGNNILEPGEQCETGTTTSCTALGYAGGTLGCVECQFDLALCTGLQTGTCGDGILNNGEACDGTTIPATCPAIGFQSGTLSCDACQLDTTACSAKTVCGDGTIQPGEQCDGTNYGNVQSCSDIVPRFTGQPTCNPAMCQFDLSACGGLDYCGDGKTSYSAGEQCDTNVPLGVTCTTFGDFAGGSLSCDVCSINTTACTGVPPGSCGDNIIQAGEQCDGTNLGTSTQCDRYAPGTQGTVVACTNECRLDLTTCEEVTTAACPYNCVSNGLCEELCTTDNQCSPDPDCGSPAPSCPYTCYADDSCVAECSTHLNCSADPDCGGKNWLPLVLIILGVLLLIGCSAYLLYAYSFRTPQGQGTYSETEQRGTGLPPSLGTLTSGSSPGARQEPRLSPEQREKMMAALQKKRQEELSAFKEHAASKADERKKVISSFGETEYYKSATKPVAKQEKTEPSLSRTVKEVEAQQKKTTPESSSTDDYVEIDSLAKNNKETKKAESAQSKPSSKKLTPQEQKKKKSSDKEDPFAELDDLIDKL